MQLLVEVHKYLNTDNNSNNYNAYDHTGIHDKSFFGLDKRESANLCTTTLLIYTYAPDYLQRWRVRLY